MTQIVTLVAPRDRFALTEIHLDAARDAAARVGAEPDPNDNVLSTAQASEFAVAGGARESISAALSEAPELAELDWAVTPAGGRRKSVLVSDMDSTMIAIETLDTLASELGFGEAVAAITERSMAGELDFVESLRERVALLKGFRADSALDAVMAKVVHSPGAEIAVRTMVANGCLCALVSGGFTFTTEVVHKALGFQEHAANTLEIGPDGCFTGDLTGRIVGRDTKLEILREMCARQGVGPEAAIAIGDGANDLDMIEAAGLGVGYFPKPVVRARAAYRIEHTDMTTLLYFQGYRDDEFVA